MIKIIYFCLIGIITIWTIYLYIKSDAEYKNEIRRINYLENKIRREKDHLNYHRLNTIPCHVPNLNNPRDCYMGSNYNCKWNEDANRCNQHE